MLRTIDGAGNGLAIAAAAALFACASAGTGWGAVAGEPGDSDLVVAADGATEAIVVVAPGASKADGPLSRRDTSPTRYERFAAEELVRCIGLMCGAEPELADTDAAVKAALEEKQRPVLIVGSEALRADSRLLRKLHTVARDEPVLRADAIVVQREGNRVYLAGLTDDGHAHAVAELLHRWGCRWYVPTGFGECIPHRATLAVGDLRYAYASPFEIRTYWVSWNGSYEGFEEFQLHNRMTRGVSTPGAGHALGKYTRELVPEGGTVFNVPIAEDETAAHVAAQLEEVFRTGGSVSLAIEDGAYKSDSEADKRLQAGLFDKYFMIPSVSDVFMTFYNKVSEILLEKYPDSRAQIGFLAYANMTIPPQRVQQAAAPLFCSLAPIDIDPNHGMDDPWSPPRQEYREMMYRWADVMQGRVWIYDYDQGALVWRDIPNPSHQAFRQDVKHYAKAGVLGISTESRNAIATTFLNLHIRGQLMWNPDADVDALLEEFYPAFYGPAANPMSEYWGAVFDAWDGTIVTEHEFFMAPAIYTRELVETMRRALSAAERAVAPLRAREDLDRNEKLVLERLRFTRLGFDVLDGYMTMVWAGASECDYARADEAGRKALAARRELAGMNPTFTTRVLGVAAEPEYGGGAAWFPGEVKLYGDLHKLVSGAEGERIALLPLEWAFRRDPHDTGLARGWGLDPEVDLSFWNAHRDEFPLEKRKDYPTTEWEMLRTDLYMQAQGVLHPDAQAFSGFAWYATSAALEADQAGRKIHLRLPGLFGEAWLYVNGRLVAHREQNAMWWYNDYGFQWDVDLTGELRPGENTFVIRNAIEHHVGGLFRRAFLYAPKQ